MSRLHGVLNSFRIRSSLLLAISFYNRPRVLKSAGRKKKKKTRFAANYVLFCCATAFASRVHFRRSPFCGSFEERTLRCFLPCIHLGNEFMGRSFAAVFGFRVFGGDNYREITSGIEDDEERRPSSRSTRRDETVGQTFFFFCFYSA